MDSKVEVISSGTFYLVSAENRFKIQPIISYRQDNLYFDAMLRLKLSNLTLKVTKSSFNK
jgi:hypothetical protein